MTIFSKQFATVCRQPICKRWAIHSQSRRQLPGFGQRMRRSAETSLRPLGVEIVPRLSRSSPENGKQADNRPNWRKSIQRDRQIISSSGPDSSHKRAFLIAFSEFQKGQRFLGLRHVALDNGIQFGSLFSERLGQGGQDITTASDRDVQPGKTYRYRVYAVRPTPQGPRSTGVSNVLTIRIPEN